MREAILYDRLKDKRVRCNVCRRRCIISPGKYGYCKTRLNKDGILYTLIYGKVSSFSLNPIEKKPLYHFYPGTIYFSLGSLGCNFKCPGCQNWDISHVSVEKIITGAKKITPEESIAMSIRYRCQGISWTFNEPTIWLEYTLDGARLAKKRGLYTVYVTNGFITPEGLAVIGQYLDVFRVDIKGFSEATYKRISGVNALSGVLESTKLAMHKYHMWVECVTNITPGINDDEDELEAMARWIKDELGADTPWHVTRFYPWLELSNIPITPLNKLKRIQKIGYNTGLHYVYLGNVPGDPGENTYCYTCRELLIERDGFTVTKLNIKDNKCPNCGTEIYGRFNN